MHSDSSDPNQIKVDFQLKYLYDIYFSSATVNAL